MRWQGSGAETVGRFLYAAGYAFAPQRPAELLALDEAMEELAQVSAEKCVEMHFFGGMTHA